MLSVALGYYGIVATLVFTAWLSVFWQDVTTPKTDMTSWIALVVGSSLWVIILPFAYLELMQKKSH